MLPQSVKKLIEEFSKLPGIGPKSAQRIAMHLLNSHDVKIKNLGESVLKFREGLRFCNECFNLSEGEKCYICIDQGRDSKIICVVEEILDVLAVEKTAKFKGLYHVLHGVISPVDGIGPDQLKVEDLFNRVKRLVEEGDATDIEVILATNPSIEGETTALFLQKHLKNMGVKVTRIARGLPVGGDLDYADEYTLLKALEGRGEY